MMLGCRVCCICTAASQIPNLMHAAVVPCNSVYHCRCHGHVNKCSVVVHSHNLCVIFDLVCSPSC
jgi:hypothetical protein